MEAHLYKKIREDKQMLFFLRRHPIWYRKLSRDVNDFEQFNKEMRVYYGKTAPQRIAKMKNQLNMIDMIMSLTKAMKD